MSLPMWRVSMGETPVSRACVREVNLPMLHSPHTTTSDTAAPCAVAVAALPEDSPQTLQDMRALLNRLQAELKFKQTKIEALNFELARLKRWRFGSSSESLDTSTQAVLFDSLLIDTALENFFARLKQYRAIATRYDKTARNFLGAIHLAASMVWLV